MKQQMNATRIVILLAIVAATIGFSAFRQKDSTRQKSFRESYSGRDEDTTTRRKRDRSKDEFNMAGLDQAMKELDRQMAELDKGMKSLDFSALQHQLDTEMKKVDFDKIGAEVEEAMKKIDWDKMQADINKSMKEMKKVNMGKVKLEMEKAKVQLQKEKMNMHIDTDKIMKQVEEEMEKAKVNMAEAKEEMNNLKAFTGQLEKDGLIDKSKAYKIEVKDGELYLNGTRQSKEVSDKYRQYYKKGNMLLHNNPDEKKRSSI